MLELEATLGRMLPDDDFAPFHEFLKEAVKASATGATSFSSLQRGWGQRIPSPAACCQGPAAAFILRKNASDLLDEIV